jgi:putative ABC transport system ATP-binding protein
MSLISVDRLTKTYGEGGAAVDAISGISFTIAAGEFVAVMGESGAGKSTLLSVLGAMNTPTSGTFTVDGVDVYGLTSEQRADFRREYLGFIFQSFHLVDYLNVMENVMLPLTTLAMARREKESMALQALAWVGLESKAGRLPNQISGGEKERVAVARAIVNEPPILLADEPTGNLDSRNSNEVMALLQRLNQAGMTIVMVTHSRRCAAFSRKLLTVTDGRLLASGPLARTPAESNIRAA